MSNEIKTEAGEAQWIIDKRHNKNKAPDEIKTPDEIILASMALYSFINNDSDNIFDIF